MYADPYAAGVLLPQIHSQLVRDMIAIARDAAIQPDWISSPLKNACGTAEITWVKRFKFHAHEGHTGLCFIGKNPKVNSIEDRMSAIAGALVRNFIRARMRPAC
jgi:hypothetical protein